MMNGIKAPMRYVLCTCHCHDGDPVALITVMDMLHGWDVDPPGSAKVDDVSRFVDTINVLATPGFRPVHEENLDEDEDDMDEDYRFAIFTENSTDTQTGNDDD